MSENPAPSPSAFLEDAKREQLALIYSYLDSVDAALRQRFPRSEQATWPFQLPEAAAVIAAGEGATLALAPYLTQVCEHQFGEATPEVRLQQVKDKAPVVNALAVSLLALGAMVNGKRAKAEDMMAAAEDFDGIFTVRSVISSEVEGWRATAGI